MLAMQTWILMMMVLMMRRLVIARIERHAAQVGHGVHEAVTRCVALIGSAVQHTRARAARRRQSGRTGARLCDEPWRVSLEG